MFMGFTALIICLISCLSLRLIEKAVMMLCQNRECCVSLQTMWVVMFWSGGGEIIKFYNHLEEYVTENCIYCREARSLSPGKPR